jgi:hypothetical protein
MSDIDENQLKEDAKAAAGLYRSDSLETRAAFLRAIGDELGIVAAMNKPQLQSVVIDAARDVAGRKSLLERATFVRAIIDALGMDARMVVSGEKRRRHEVA